MVRRKGEGDVPVVVVNRHVNLERRRFTLAHELAHRIIDATHAEKSELEKWCNRFAGAFLIPCVHLQNKVGQKRKAFGYQELIDLKRLYRVAASALLIRLEQVGVIHHSSLQYAFRTFARGWRSKEPNPLEQSSNAAPFEKPRRFERLVYRALAEDMIAPSKAAELLRQPVTEVEEGLILLCQSDRICGRREGCNNSQRNSSGSPKRPGRPCRSWRSFWPRCGSSSLRRPARRRCASM